MKGEQGKNLESYKIFTKQRHERIIAFYDSLCTLVGAMWRSFTEVNY